jgi:alpha-ketoglutarate-dependent taurine dioxygenase
MLEDIFQIYPLAGEKNLPFVVEPRETQGSLTEIVANERGELEDRLLMSGALLFRGGGIEDAAAFRHFVHGFGYPLATYDFGSTPRTQVVDGIYTSTEYPASQDIPLHNEQSYTREWAMKLWFCCALPARSGGETPIADSREIYSRISHKLRERFVSKGLLYVRNYGNGLDIPWQKVFNTESRREVEAYCGSKGILCEWKHGGDLRTRQLCQVVERHPITSEMVWFNQAHLFHVSALQPKVREALLGVVDTEDLPRNVYYGDGTEIELDVLEEIRSVIKEVAVSFAWQRGDVLMIDNMLTAHGRTAFAGDRRVLVAMADIYSNTN